MTNQKIAENQIRYDHQKKPHVVHSWDDFCLNILLHRYK